MISPWKVIRSKYTYRDRWLSLRTDTCVTGRGKQLDAYHVVELPDWVNVIALTDRDEIVLVREYRHGARQIFTALPSGTVDTDDDSSEVTSRRELEEETGYVGEHFFKTGEYFANPAIQSNRCSTYFCPLVHLTGKVSQDEGEDLEVVTMPFVDFVQGSWTGELPVQAIHAAGIHFTLGFLARSHDPRLERAQKILKLICR